MGVDVVLKRVSQAGTSPRRRALKQVDVVLDLRDKFAELCGRSGSPMLNRVDPYGTLILRSNEMNQFRSEVEAAQKLVEDTEVGELLDEVLRLAGVCAGDLSTELHLEGD